MNSFLNCILTLQAYADRSINSNPAIRFFDWKRNNSGISVQNPRSEAYSVDPGASILVFDGTRITTLDGTTAFSVALSPLEPSRYRFTWTGGTNPTFRTNRNLAFNTIQTTFAVQANNTVTVTLAAGPDDFTGVVVGDTIFIPNTNTGDSSNVISLLNSGFWNVLAVVSTTEISLQRPTGATFEGVSEVVTLTSNSQFQAFSTAGVQVGDRVDISAGFATGTLKTFEIITVTANFFEVISSSPIAAQTGITPTASGLIVYTDSKSLLYIESDQETVLRINGSTDNSQRLSPIEAGNSDKPGLYLKRGPSWSLTIINRSSVTANVVVMHAE